MDQDVAGRELDGEVVSVRDADDSRLPQPWGRHSHWIRHCLLPRLSK